MMNFKQVDAIWTHSPWHHFLQSNTSSKKKTVITKRKTYKEMMQSEWKDNKHMNEYNLTNIGYPTYT